MALDFHCNKFENASDLHTSIITCRLLLIQIVNRGIYRLSISKKCQIRTVAKRLSYLELLAYMEIYASILPPHSTYWFLQSPLRIRLLKLSEITHC